MKIYAIFPDDAYMKSMSIHMMEKPSQELQKNGVLCMSQGQFFTEHCSSVSKDDIVIMWIGTRNESWLDAMSSLQCRKFLRNIDTCKMDKVLFKREQEIFHRVRFEAMLVTYCTEYNRKFLSDRNIRNIDYPHLLDFSESYNIPSKNKQYDVLISGQMSDYSYPLRTRVASLFMSHKEKYKIAFLPHPGHSKQTAGHQFYGDNFIKLAADCRLGIVCTGDDDSMVMKYLEFAKAGTLPMGDIPSNMPELSKSSLLCVSKDDSDDVIIKKIDDILSQSSNADQRIRTYREGMSVFDIEEGTKVVLHKIVNSKYDA